MKSHRKELCFEIPRRRAFLNITPEIEACLRESGIREGLCLVNAMHISASVFINDDESGLHQDFEKWLEKLAPEDIALREIAEKKIIDLNCHSIESAMSMIEGSARAMGLDVVEG